MQRFLWKISERLETFERWMVLGGVMLVAGFTLAQILLRNFFSTGVVWGDTLLRHLVLWIGMLGATQATVGNRHIQIIILPKILPLRAGALLRRLSQFFSLIVSLVLLYASLVFLMNERKGGMTAFADIPVWYFETIFPLTFSVMALRFTCHLLSPLPQETEETIL